MPVAELLARTPSRELTDWMAYEKMTGPLGPERADLHAGIIAATIANANRGKGKRRFRPADFMPKWDRPRATTPSAMANMLKTLTRKMGGRVRKRGD